MTNRFNTDDSIDVRATLSRKHYKLLVHGMATLEIPDGVTLRNKAGSRVLQFSCEGSDVFELLCEGLDGSGISWNEI